jgi:hypothetical protein
MKLIDCAVRDLYTYKNKVIGSQVNLRVFNAICDIWVGGGGPHPLNFGGPPAKY